MATARGASEPGTIVAAHGRRYVIEVAGGERLDCVPRGKRSEVACGDRVGIRRTAANQGVIETLAPRSSLFYRSDAFRQKIVAANVSQVVVVLATSPTFYEELLNRCLVAAECGGARAVIVLNKCDLPTASQALDDLGVYAALGYPVVPLRAREHVNELVPWLAGQTSVLVGQSGMGKSTIINMLLPEARVPTAEVSSALDSGRHTTTHATLHRLAPDTSVIDSPGMQEFGLHHLRQTDVDAAFPEFRPFIGRCRFANCRHLQEPDCAIDAATASGHVARRRLAAYRSIVRDLPRVS
ncbi:MAG: ribosome small subunit-dependent GTPase A [Betaproteobacteria bacterium]|nr:ribosome small subunit-dependent GTPase A [Betaproteobacteria bacterium]